MNQEASCALRQLFPEKLSEMLLGESEWERKEPAAVKPSAAAALPPRRENGSQINFCALESRQPQLHHCHKVGIETAFFLGLLFICVVFIPLTVAFLAFCPFFLLCWGVKESGKQEINLFVSSRNCLRQQFGLEPTEFCFWDFPSGSVGTHVARGQLWPWQGQQGHSPTIPYKEKLPVTA